MQNPLDRLEELCPKCSKLGAVLTEDNRLGRIYECFHCYESKSHPFQPDRRHLTWALPNGSKKVEVFYGRI